MVNSQKIPGDKSDRKFQERLRAGRKAIKYVAEKTVEREQVMKTYLDFPDISSPLVFIDSSLKELKSDSASSSDLLE